MKITHMRTNGFTNPLGFHVDPLRLSWIVDGDHSASNFQEAAQIEMAEDEQFQQKIFDSGKDHTLNALSFSPNINLQPRTRYFWRVTVWGDEGDHTSSDTAWFETAKLDEPWVGQWVTPAHIEDHQDHPLVRYAFDVQKPLRSARIYACGLGVYELFLNGEKANEEYLTPGFHAYDYWLQYQTYDISDQLKNGQNIIGFSLGNGWYKGRFGLDDGEENLYGDSFAAIADIVLTYEDGTTDVLGTNNEWQWKASPVTFSSIYDGEIYDATKETPSWTKDLSDSHTWKAVKIHDLSTSMLSARYSPKVKITETLKPKSILHTPVGETVLDMGQNMTGWVRFQADAPEGASLQLQYGEVLQEDCFYQENLRTAEAQYTFVSNGEPKEVEPSFTFFGFRYVKLIGFENVNLDDFLGCVVHSDMEHIGKIETSDSGLNQLFSNALWSQRDNFLDVPTDCPQRDERLGWTGDAQIFAATASMNMHTQAFFHKYMRDVREEQTRMNGAVPFIVPEPKPKNGSTGLVSASSKGSTVWGDAATIIPWVLYQQYGDLVQLEEHFPVMKDWVDYLYQQDEETKKHRLLTEGFHFGDWLALDGQEQFNEDRFGATDVYFIATAYYYYSSLLTSKAAKALHKEDEAEKYQRLAEEIKHAFQQEYFSANGNCTVSTQTSHVLALYMDLVPENHRESIQQELQYLLTKNKSYLQTGFVGTPYLNHALSNHGMDILAYTLLLNNKYPSWLYEVEMGATTIWERWNSILPDGKISGTGMNSLNHYAYGSIVEWMYTKMCGIQTSEDKPGYKKVILHPHPDDRLSYARASIDTVSGTIACGWDLTEQEITITCSIPFDVEAVLVLPKAAGKEITINNENVDKTFMNEENNNVIMPMTKGNYRISYEANQSFTLEKSIDKSMNYLFMHGGVRDVIDHEIPELSGEEIVWTNYPDVPIQDLLTTPAMKGMVDPSMIQKLQQRMKNS